VRIDAVRWELLSVAKPIHAAVFAAALLLCGCQTAFNAVGVAVPLSASESRKYDGSYQGYVTPVSATGPGCPVEKGEKVLMVGDGVLWYAYNPTTLFSSAIAYDGSINATSGTATMTGKVVGNHLEATVTSPQCQTQISMNYLYNHS
jgi:hypothetical protein